MSGRSSSPEPAAVTPEQYAGFIQQLELLTVWLHDVGVQNHRGPETPAQAQSLIDARASWKPSTEGFQALQAYRLRLESAGETAAEIDVTFGLRFRSQDAMTDALFAVFQEVNLPVNSWPYLREFVAAMLGRMNWQPFTLPALKRGTGRTAADRRATTTRRTRSVRRAGA